MDGSERAAEGPPPSYLSCARSDFHVFAALPVEIRVKIWQAAMAPRIVRWIRKANGNLFTAPSGSLPLLSVCQESRETALLYGQYRILTDASTVYFSPLIDYVWLDPAWMTPNTPLAAPESPLDTRLDTLREQFGDVRNVMVHPNWSGVPKEPSLPLASISSIRRILVAADEKSIGMKGAVMLDTIQDLKYYYYNVLKRAAAIKIPYLAVGCLGWVGPERRALSHGAEDKRQLLTVFETYGEMRAHNTYLREEQRMFVEEQKSRSRSAHMFPQIPIKKEPRGLEES